MCNIRIDPFSLRSSANHNTYFRSTGDCIGYHEHNGRIDFDRPAERHPAADRYRSPYLHAHSY